MRALERLGRIAFGLVFLLAAAWKLADLGAFEATIARFGIVYDPWVPATARTLIGAESAVGLGLVRGWRVALPAALAFVLLFVAVLVYGLHLGLEVECRCFGPGPGASLAQALWRDLVLLALGGYLYWRHGRERRTSSKDRT